MNTPLDEAYGDLAVEARNYADPDKVLREVQRRRSRRARLAAVAAVVALTILGFATVIDRPSQLAAPQSSAVPTISPPATAVSLPADAAAGRGTMIYTACPYGCPTYLVVEGGRQYLLGQQTAPPPGNLTLSPDGRWLGQPTSTGFAVRDLLGINIRFALLEPSKEEGMRLSPWAWAADSSRLVLGAHADGKVARYLSLTVGTGKPSRLEVPAGAEPVGMLGSGELLLLDERSYDQLPLTSVPLQIGRSGRSVELRLDPPGSKVFADHDHGLSLQVRGDHIFALAYSSTHTSMVKYDVAGRQLSETTLSDTDAALGPVTDGFAVLSAATTTGKAAQLVVLNGFERQVLATLPSQALAVLPGGTRH